MGLDSGCKRAAISGTCHSARVTAQGGECLSAGRDCTASVINT